MHTCIYVCIHVKDKSCTEQICLVPIHARMHMQVTYKHTNVHAWMYACIYMDVCIHAYIQTYIQRQSAWSPSVLRRIYLLQNAFIQECMQCETNRRFKLWLGGLEKNETRVRRTQPDTLGAKLSYFHTKHIKRLVWRIIQIWGRVAGKSLRGLVAKVKSFGIAMVKSLNYSN
jgi:hypothetical protein